jgi:hypothetical protein
MKSRKIRIVLFFLVVVFFGALIESSLVFFKKPYSPQTHPAGAIQ